MMVRRIVGKGLVALLLMSGIVVSASSTAASAQTSCPTGWGSLEKSGTSTSNPGLEREPSLLNIRSGRNECYDRLVMDLDSSPGHFSVQYVDRFVGGNGSVVPLRGGADLEIKINATEIGESSELTYDPPDKSEAVAVAGYDTFRQVVFSGSFEDESLIGLGVRARLPFRVFALAGPGDGSRLVVDVAHSWNTQKTIDLFFSTGDLTDCTEVTGFPRGADGVIAPIRFSLEALVEGPTEAEESAGASSWFSAATAGSVKSVNLRSDGLLIVDFSDFSSTIPGASSSCGSAALLANLNSTVFQFAAVKKVRYQFSGSCEAFGEFVQTGCIDFRNN